MDLAIAFESVWREARRCWSWWIGELSECIPPKVKARLAGARTDIYPQRNCIEIVYRDPRDERRFLENKPFAELSDGEWAEIATFLLDRTARIILSPRDAFWFRLELPRRAGRNLPSAITLQMELTSPLDPASVAWSWTPSLVDRDRVEVVVAETRLALIDEWDRLFASRGLTLPPVYCETLAGLLCLRKGKRIFRSQEGARNLRAIVIALGMIALLPVALLLGAQILIARTEAQLSTVRREIAPRIEADREARRQVRIWQAWEPLSYLTPATIILGDLGARVPEGGSLENLDITNERKLRFELAGLESDAAAEAMVASDGLLLISGPMDAPTSQASSFAMRAEMP